MTLFIGNPKVGAGVLSLSDRIFDAAFVAASEAMPEIHAGKPYAGEYVFSEALQITTDVLAGVLSSCPEQRRAARNRLDLLLSGKESS